MVSFVCNICGRSNQVEHFATEPASCACGSNVRIRALIHLLSMEIFGQSMALVDFPTLKSIRGLGMTDQPGYATLLAEKFDYTNTFYDREPRMDFTAVHPELYGSYDFVLSADVLEHIAPPVERALDEVCRLLKPRGFLGITVFCNPSDKLREHFPELHTYRTVALGDSMVLINRRSDGVLEIHDQLIFHGGPGATLEMREFGITSLKQKLIDSGFCDVHLLTEDIPAYGILFDHDVSQPMIARKEPFAVGNWVVRELLNQCQRVEAGLTNQLRLAESELANQRSALEAALNESRTAETELASLRAECETLRAQCETLRAQIRMAGDSRWLKLGRRFGLGPNFA